MKAIDADELIGVIDNIRESFRVKGDITGAVLMCMVIQIIKNRPEVDKPSENEFKLPESHKQYMMKDFERKR